jgi:hypothetical protein
MNTAINMKYTIKLTGYMIAGSNPVHVDKTRQYNNDLF